MHHLGRKLTTLVMESQLSLHHNQALFHNWSCTLKNISPFHCLSSSLTDLLTAQPTRINLHFIRKSTAVWADKCTVQWSDCYWECDPMCAKVIDNISWHLQAILPAGSLQSWFVTCRLLMNPAHACMGVMNIAISRSFIEIFLETMSSVKEGLHVF